jgi:hypothetical protein
MSRKLAKRFVFATMSVLFLIAVGISSQAQQPPAAPATTMQPKQATRRGGQAVQPPAEVQPGGNFGAGGESVRGRGTATIGFGANTREISLPSESALLNEDAEVIQLRVWVISIKASGEQVAAAPVANLLARADSLPQTLDSSAIVRDLIVQLKNAKILYGLREFRISAGVGQTAQQMLGAQRPIVTNTTMNAVGGGRVNSYQYMDIGTQVFASPRIESSSAVSVAIQFRDSAIDENERSVAVMESKDGQPTLKIPEITSHIVQTSVRFNRGGAAVIETNSVTNAEGGIAAELLILGEVRGGNAN